MSNPVPNIPVGRIKIFGPFGPRYFINKLSRKTDDGDWLVDITFVDSDEDVEYRLSHMKNDPEAE